MISFPLVEYGPVYPKIKEIIKDASKLLSYHLDNQNSSHHGSQLGASSVINEEHLTNRSANDMYPSSLLIEFPVSLTLSLSVVLSSCYFKQSESVKEASRSLCNYSWNCFNDCLSTRLQLLPGNWGQLHDPQNK